MRPIVHPTIGSAVYVPRRYLSRDGVEGIMLELTAQHFDQQTKVTTDVPLYRETKHGIYLPRAWVRDRLPTIWRSALDRTTPLGQRSGVWPQGVINARNAKQQDFMDRVSRLVKLAIDGEPVDTQIHAGTGTGKTVAMIKATCDNAITNAMVIVHRNNLRAQWEGSEELKKGLRFFFGEDWVAKNVGIVQQDRQEWDKPFVIAMGPTLVNRHFSKEVYASRGLIWVDEIHKFAAPVLQQCLSMFRARARIGATATLKQGSMAIVINSQLGKPSVVSKQKALQPNVQILEYHAEVSWWKYNGPDVAVENVKECDERNMLLTLLPRLDDRTDLLARVAYERGYAKGRNGLILGDRVDHLVEFRQRMIDLGADPDQCGLYVGEHTTDQYKLTGHAFKRDGTKVTFRALPLFDTYAKARSYAKRAAGPGGELHPTIKKYRHKLTDEERDHIEKNCQFIFATYGIFDTGADVSRLDWGMELTPRGDVEQAVGRILRIHEGKPIPSWYSVLDVLHQKVPVMGSTDLIYRYSTPKRLADGRLKSYKNQNAKLNRIKDPRRALDKS